jgi:SAM-dependent methyltransferase
MRILNIGCGDETYGTDRLDIQKTATSTVVHDVEKGIPFPDDSFDIVYEKNCLEHLRNVGFHFEEVKRVLKRTGLLILITDNSACLKYYTLGTHTGGYRKAGGLDVHFSIFTKEHLRNHLNRVGLHVHEITFVDTDYPTKYFDKLVRVVAPSLSHARIKVVAEK